MNRKFKNWKRTKDWFSATLIYKTSRFIIDRNHRSLENDDEFRFVPFFRIIHPPFVPKISLYNTPYTRSESPFSRCDQRMIREAVFRPIEEEKDGAGRARETRPTPSNFANGPELRRRPLVPLPPTAASPRQRWSNSPLEIRKLNWYPTTVLLLMRVITWLRATKRFQLAARKNIIGPIHGREKRLRGFVRGEVSTFFFCAFVRSEELVLFVDLNEIWFIN